MRWCHRCKIWYEKCDIGHQHTNHFAKSIFDFKGAAERKMNYCKIICEHVNDIHHNHLRRSYENSNTDGIKPCLVCSPNISQLCFNDLLAEHEIKNIKNAGILTVESLLININYFKHERVRQLYFYGI